jgi:hypothetical protein
MLGSHSKFLFHYPGIVEAASIYVGEVHTGTAPFSAIRILAASCFDAPANSAITVLHKDSNKRLFVESCHVDAERYLME